ncbi:IclR family transcriptional regulator [Actinomadura opuntiae]|uniref:IclR family transcriptional regulator n=1 Tax=Actinomadura sp. OS1-43 TaxID=604315 RepID=UPI00255A78E6|nr:IclR family transcriptional regulator [Actinomadura sp. OS1-43]MDL4818526.1 IclR family transcriptional regulator [Actinomadura sp. OS1-43]
MITAAAALTPIDPGQGDTVQGETDTVLSKVRLILEAFRPDDEGLSLAELVRRTGLRKATVYRLSQELVAWGALERAGVGYRVGLRLFELGLLAPRQRILRDIALPFLEELAQSTQETVHCAVRDGGDVLYVEKLGGHRSVTRPSRTGGRMPLHCTATGKVLLAHAPSRVVEELLARPLRRLTGHTVIAPRLLRMELERIRSAGYAVESEEARVGFLSVAAPVRAARGRVAGAISVAAPTSRTQLARLVPAVLTTAGRISETFIEYELDQESP